MRVGFAPNDDFIVGTLGLVGKWRVVIESLCRWRCDGNFKNVNEWGFPLEHIICVLIIISGIEMLIRAFVLINLDLWF